MSLYAGASKNDQLHINSTASLASGSMHGHLPVIICGGGIMGCSTAYHLAKRGVKSIILESTGIASGASGRAGGFLPRDWCIDTPMQELIHASFDLLKEFVEEFPECDYRRMRSLAVEATQGRSVPSKMKTACPKWIKNHVEQVTVMGTPDNTAQVNPYKLTSLLLKQAKELVGVEVKICEVESFKVDKGRIRGVKTKNGEKISSGRVVIAMGAWCSRHLVRSLGVYPVRPYKGASIVMRDCPATNDILFMSYTPRATRERDDTEWHPRVDGTLFVCGQDKQDPLPDRVSEVHPTASTIDRLKATVEEMAPGYSIKTYIEQACYLPTTMDGKPLIGNVGDVKGLYIATGHSVWGILGAMGTGAALAELILDGKCKMLNLKPFDPNRDLVEPNSYESEDD